MKTIAGFDRIGEENAFAVLARAAELAQGGMDIINLGIGQPDFPTPPNIVEAAVKALRDGQHGYTPATGILPLREAVSGDLNVQSFARFKRALKGFATYQRGLFKRAVDAGHRQLAANMAAAVLRDGDDSFLRDALDKLARDGITPRQLDRVDAAE